MLRTLLCAALLFFYLASQSTAQPTAAEPTLQQLLARVSVLSPEEQGIDQFSFSYKTTYLNQGRLWGEFRWKRGMPPQHYLSADSRRSPMLLVADQQAMYFDLAQQRIITMDQSCPYLRLRNKGQSLSYEFSIEPYDTRLSRQAIQIDLPSFVQVPTHNRVLGNDSHGNWRYQSTSPSGNSIQIATFDSEPPHTLREIVISDIVTGEVGLRIHDIRLNDQCNAPWLRFPTADALPDGLAVVPMKREQLNVGMQLAIGWNKMIETITTVHMAVENEALRAPPLNVTPDQWKRMEQTKQRFGPQLRELIGIGEPPQ